MISAYKSCAAFIKAMKKAGSNPQFMNVSFVGSKALAAELGAEGRGVGISQVVPFPWNTRHAGRQGVPRRHQSASNSTAEFGFGGLEGYIAARVFVEGLRRAGNESDARGLRQRDGDSARLRHRRVLHHLYAL